MYFLARLRCSQSGAEARKSSASTGSALSHRNFDFGRWSNIREQTDNLTKPWNQCLRDTFRPSAIESHPYILPAAAGMAQAA